MDKWLDGRAVAELAPGLCPAVHKRWCQSRTVGDALQNDVWISDIIVSLSVSTSQDFIRLCERVQQVSLAPDVPDKLIWCWTADQQYSASSAYKAFFLGQCAIPGAKELSKVRAPPSCKFFFRFALLGRCWTSERLQRHCLPACSAPRLMKPFNICC
jgi:hypothetical protein